MLNAVVVEMLQFLQMCSMRVNVDDLEDFLKTSTDNINSHLPEEIKVMGIR